jgi:hypothetical protein
MALIERPVANLHTFGLHWCSLCAAEGRCGPDSRTSQYVLLVPGVDCLYETPIWIGHYVLDHGYRPPEKFCKAVIDCPAPGSWRFRSSLSSYLAVSSVFRPMFGRIDAHETRRPSREYGDELEFHARRERLEVEGTDALLDRESADARLIEEHGGLATSRCRWSGCTQQALADMELCIDHAYPDRVPERVEERILGNLRRQRMLKHQRALGGQPSAVALPPLRATIPSVTICPNCFVRQSENVVLVDDPFCPHCAAKDAAGAEIVVELLDEFLRRRTRGDFEDMLARTEASHVLGARSRALRLALIAELQALKLEEGRRVDPENGVLHGRY